MKRAIFVLVFSGIFFHADAQKSEVFQAGKKAIKGYDPVAYYTESDAIKGTEAFKAEWNDATWYFSSKENLSLFTANPENYAPQFGGYCAYAVSQGYTYQSDPKAWSIVGGKLYLNYNSKIKEQWEANQAEFIEFAEKNWPRVLSK